MTVKNTKIDISQESLRRKMNMKKSKFILGVVALTAAIGALSGCDSLTAIRNIYTNDEYGTVTLSDDETYYSLTTESFIDEDEEAIDMALAADSVTVGASSMTTASLKWKNPVTDSALDGITVAFDLKVEETSSDSWGQIFGFYDDASGGFLSFGYSGWYLNADANTSSGNQSYIDAVAYGLEEGSDYKTVVLVISEDGVSTYCDAELLSTKTSFTGDYTSADAVLKFVRDSADYILTAESNTFGWTGPVDGTYVKNLKVYNTALSTSDLATLFGSEIVDTSDSTIELLNVCLNGDGVAASFVNAYLNGVPVLENVTPSTTWYATTDATTTVQLTAGDTLTYSFNGSDSDTDVYQLVNLMFGTESWAKVAHLRGDNWLNGGTLWDTKAGASANGTFYNDYTYTYLYDATSSDEILVKVYFDGENAYITIYINNLIAYKTNSTLWS